MLDTLNHKYSGNSHNELNIAQSDLLILFSGVEKCSPGWPIRGQEPDTEANQGAKKNPAFYIDFPLGSHIGLRTAAEL